MVGKLGTVLARFASHARGERPGQAFSWQAVGLPPAGSPAVGRRAAAGSRFASRAGTRGL